MMNKRYQVNIRLDQDLIEEIDRLASEDAVDRSEMARRLLDHGVASRRKRRALEEYRSGNVTAWRAAELAGVSLYEMLDRIHDAGIAYDLDTDVLERVGALAGRASAVGEGSATYGADSGVGSGQDDEASGISALRRQFKPDRVVSLFVGESAPAGRTHFYRASSNLFRATREAFALAFEPEAISDGPRFLRDFQDRGCWLVDLVDRPVNRLGDKERQALVSDGVAGLAQTIADVQPEHIIAVKATIDDEVRAAMEVAGVEAELVALPFPVRQWRAVYVRKLAESLRRWG
jgi:hypothetical protein